MERTCPKRVFISVCTFVVLDVRLIKINLRRLNDPALVPPPIAERHMDQNTAVDDDKISSAEVEALRAQAAAELAAPKPENKKQRRERERQEAVLAMAARSKPKYTAPVNADSIRQQIRTRLLAGQSTKEIAAYLAEAKPGTAAAAKSTIHIAFYRSKLRQEGLLPKVGT